MNREKIEERGLRERRCFKFKKKEQEMEAGSKGEKGERRRGGGRDVSIWIKENDMEERREINRRREEERKREKEREKGKTGV